MSTTSFREIEEVDDKTILVDGVRYIRSWKGKKSPKRRTQEEKTAYMQAYRLSKKHQLSNLKRANLELEQQIELLLKKKS